MKKYKINETRIAGVSYRYISFANFKTKWLPSDPDAEKKAIKAADLWIIKNNLPYFTKIIIPLEK